MRTKTRLLSVIAVAFLTTGTPINAQAPPKEPVIVKIKVCEPMRITGDVKLLLDSPLVNGTLVGKSFDVNGGYIVKEGIKVVLGTQTLTAGTATPLTFVLPKDIVVPAKTEPAIGSIFFVDEKDESKFVVLLTIGGKKIEPGDYQKLDSSDFAVAVQSNQIDNAKTSKEAAIANNNAMIANGKANALATSVNNLDSEFKKFKGKTIAAINANNSIAAKAQAEAAQAKAQAEAANGRISQAERDAAEAKAKADAAIAQANASELKAAEAIKVANSVDGKLADALNKFAETSNRLTKLENAPKAPPVYLPPAAASIPEPVIYRSYCGLNTQYKGWNYVHRGNGKYERTSKIGE